MFVMFMFTAMANAQHSEKGHPENYRDFLAADSTPVHLENNAYLICCVYSKDVTQFLKDNSINILRQLNDSVLIVSFNKKSSIPDLSSRFKWIKRASAHWKMSPALLLQERHNNIRFPSFFLVSVYDGGHFSEALRSKSFAGTHTSSPGTFIVSLNGKEDFEKLLNDTNVFFISAYHRGPKEELQINDLDLSVNKINLLHSTMPGLNGQDVTISVKENTPDSNDMDYAGRYLSNPLESPTSTSHASIMATMIAGAGNSWYLGRGVARAALLTASDFSNLLPDADTNYQHYHISVQNHSYGVDIENFYGADAAAYDASAIRNDSLLFVFSAGNSGNLAPQTGNYAGIPGHANLTGSFKMAKNILTVGAVDSFTVVANASSRGPAFDGRVKPELVAYGEDGSSGAAALVSGTAAVLQQAYKNSGIGKLPPAGLIKAILLNSADDVGPAGIDYTSGYGNLNALKAAEGLLAKRYYSGTVSDKHTDTFSIDIPANIRNLKFTLVWLDPPGTINNYKALVNDLDMQVRFATSGEVWTPWVLSTVANSDSLALPPLRKRDSLNNVEQITIENPVAGTYKIVVNGFHVTGSSQPFFVAWQLDSLDKFSWDFPASTDNIFPGVPNLIRYHTTLHSNAARLAYSIDRGRNWQLIDSLIDTDTGYLYWNAPDTNTLAMLKMEIGQREFITDTFTISEKLDIKVGFNCPDSVLWHWNQLAGINTYRLFGLPGPYLQPLASVTDTTYIFRKTDLPYSDFAVAPVIDGRVGMRSYTTNYTTQGIACYVNNFLGDLVGDMAYLQLQLGTTYLVKKLVFEKIRSNSVSTVLAVDNVDGLSYTASDNDLQKGINTYRVRIELTDGRTIYSASTSIFYLSNADLVIFPNPVLQNTNLTLHFKYLQNQQIKIYDALGRPIVNQKAASTSVSFPFVFAKGIYFVFISNPETNKTASYKLVCY